jgi:hypothetical protein
MSMTVGIPGSDHLERVDKATVLAIHTIAHPRHKDEPIPREWMESVSKLAAEGGHEEIKLVLGWILDFRRLMVSLPKNKAVAWGSEILTLLQKGETTSAELESNIGRMVHVGMILPKIHHFLGRL